MQSDTDTGPHRFRLPAWISCAPFEQLLAITIERAQAGEAVLSMPFLRAFAQGAGLMHGGALVSLADTAVVMAIKSVVPPGTHFATITMQSRFHHPVKKGVLRASARVAARDGNRLEGTCAVVDDDGRAVMTFESVFKIARDATIRGVQFEEEKRYVRHRHQRQPPQGR